MKILVISSCTNSKLNRKARAAELYTGLGHRYLMEGLDQARLGMDGERLIWRLFRRSTVCCPKIIS